VKIGVISSRDTALKLVTQLSERGHAASAYDVETAAVTSWDAFDAVLTLVGDDRVLTNIVLGKDGLRDRLPVSAIHVAMGMHGVESMRQLAAAHVAAGQSFVAAPLLVPTTSSADSRLAVAAGPQAALNRLSPIFDALGTTAFNAGDAPETSATLALAHFALVACAMQFTAEAFALVRKYDVAPEVMQDVITDGLFAADVYRKYGQAMVEETYVPGLTAGEAAKVLDHVMEMADRLRVPLPSVDACRDRLLGAIAHGDRDQDWTVLGREQARASGLD